MVRGGGDKGSPGGPPKGARLDDPPPRGMGPGLTAHTLRHRYASVAYQHTHDLRAVQTLLGHASVATTQVYTAVDDASVRGVAETAWRIVS